MLRAPFALLWNLVKLVVFAVKRFLFWIGHLLTRKQRKWVQLQLPARLPFGPPAGLAAYFQDKPTFTGLRDGVDVIAEDDHIEGVVVTADRLTHGPARTADLRALIDRLRDAGKKIVFHTHTIRGRDYDLAAGADQIVMTPGGRFYLFGHRFEQIFAGPLLDRLGVAAQFVHIGPYKTASHRFTKEESTLPQRLMMEQLVDSLSELREQRIQTDRALSDQRLAECFDNMPLDDRQARAYGLVDARVHRRLLRRWIEEGEDFVDAPLMEPPPAEADGPPRDPEAEAEPDGATAGSPPPAAPDQQPADAPAPAEPEDKDESRVDLKSAESYIEAVPRFDWTPLFGPRRTVATVDLSGMIVMPDMEMPGGSLTTIDPDEVLPVLRSLTEDRSVGAVVLHINSPGGSALASELLWDGIRRLRYDKPTIAYCSDVAASGGYYMAAAADRIVCQPETVTGSIGVIAGKFSVPGTLEKLDINVESVQRHETSLFESISQPLSEEVLENLQRDARSFYRQFLRRVGDARQLPRRRLHRYAKGRIYSGADAHDRFLVDHLGGFDEAVDIARALAEPAMDETNPVQFRPHRRTSLPALVRQSALSPDRSATAELSEKIGDVQFLKELVQHDPLLALMPYQLADGP